MSLARRQDHDNPLGDPYGPCGAAAPTSGHTQAARQSLASAPRGGWSEVNWVNSRSRGARAAESVKNLYQELEFAWIAAEQCKFETSVQGSALTRIVVPRALRPTSHR